MSVNLNLSVHELAAEIATGDAIFYIGAGFSMVAGMPDWGTLLDELILVLEKDVHNYSLMAGVDLKSSLDAIKAARRQGEYQYVASLLSMYLPSDAISSHVRSRFSLPADCKASVKNRVNLRLDCLMKAPIAGLITTNYDNLIESHVDFDSRFSSVALSSLDLPSLFRGKDRSNRYFLKIHGDLNGEIVLSSEDYDRVYLSSPKAENFLRATLMQSPLVFLGCSVEDAILRQRRFLFELYGDGLPPCFQVTSRTTFSEVRAAWLYKYAGIQSVFYNAATKDHLEFDEFLQTLIDQMFKLNLQMFGRPPSKILHQALGAPLEISEPVLGKMNFEIVNFVRSSIDGRCTYLQLLEAAISKFQVTDIEGMVYRIAFLVSIGALTEEEGEELIIRA